MSKDLGAPQQHKQPSRKGKKAWRKHVDVTEVQEGLQHVRQEEIEGGVVAEKPSEELFTVDTKGSEEIRRRELNNSKPLRSDQILAERSVIPAVDSRKRPKSKVTDGIVEPKSKRHKSDWVTHKEWQRLKAVAKEGNPEIQKVQGTASYDPWTDSPAPSNTEESEYNFLPKEKPIVAPSTLKHAPVSLAASGKPVPSVRNPDAGTSYNPSFEAWDNLLTKEGAKEVEAEKQRLADEKTEQERQALKDEAKGYDGWVDDSDDESAWEGFESEHESAEWLKKKRPERKTQAQRNKIKRRKEAERQAKWDARMKQREQQVGQAKEIAKTVKEKENSPNDAQEDDQSSSGEGDDEALRRRSLRKNHVPDKPLEVVLPDELQDSLRLLKPEGNLLGDRFRNLIVQGKMEARKPVVQPKKPKREYTEKWSYKDFKI